MLFFVFLFALLTIKPTAVLFHVTTRAALIFTCLAAVHIFRILTKYVQPLLL